MIFLYLLILLLSPSSLFGDYYRDHCDELYIYRRSPKSPSFEGLLKLIKTNNIHSIETLISKLPESYRKNFTLVTDSGSQHLASENFPRVILFGEDASLILAYSGNPSDPRFGSLETIEFEQDTGKFRFRKIKFEISNTTAPTSSERNPKECLTCHRRDPSPIWEEYRQSFAWRNTFFGGYKGYDSGKSNIEKFKRFWEKQKMNPRYQPLVISHLDQERPYRGYFTTEPGSPSNLFNVLLQRMNFLRICKEVKAMAGYSKFKFALSAAVAGCENIESYVPVQSRIKAVSYLTVAKEGVKKRLQQARDMRSFHDDKESDESMRSRFYENGRPKFESYDAARFVLESQGASLNHWGSDRSVGGRLNVGGGFSLEPLLCCLSTGYEKADLKNQEQKNSICRDLKSKSLAAFSANGVGASPMERKAVPKQGTTH